MGDCKGLVVVSAAVRSIVFRGAYRRETIVMINDKLEVRCRGRHLCQPSSLLDSSSLHEELLQQGPTASFVAVVLIVERRIGVCMLVLKVWDALLPQPAGVMSASSHCSTKLVRPWLHVCLDRCLPSSPLLKLCSAHASVPKLGLLSGIAYAEIGGQGAPIRTHNCLVQVELVTIIVVLAL